MCAFFCRRPPVDSRSSHHVYIREVSLREEKGRVVRELAIRRGRRVLPQSNRHRHRHSTWHASTFCQPSLHSPGAHAVSVRSKKFPEGDPGLSPPVRTRQDWCSSRRGLGLSACIDAMAGGVVWVAHLQGWDEKVEVRNEGSGKSKV